LRALRKRKPQETQMKISHNKRKRQPIGMLGRSSGNQTMIGCLPTQALAFLAGLVYATNE